MADELPALAMGWLPDYPSVKDFGMNQNKLTRKQEAAGQRAPVAQLLSEIGVKTNEQDLGRPVDLRQWFSPVEDQGKLNSCTAHAGVGLVEYFERKAHGRHIDASRLFLYRVTRNMLHWKGDIGAFLRTAMGALVLFGVPPEEYWPYDPDNVDAEPPAFCYAFAQEYQAIQYYRLDQPDTSPDELLTRVKAELSNGLPCMFGFTVYKSCVAQSQVHDAGHIPVPAEGDSIAGGHAVIAAGYDDDLAIANTDRDGRQTTGALLIRNSWGPGWGDGGYGWLPYDYVTSGLAVDWWSLIRSEWVDTKAFGQEATS